MTTQTPNEGIWTMHIEIPEVQVAVNTKDLDSTKDMTVILMESGTNGIHWKQKTYHYYIDTIYLCFCKVQTRTFFVFGIGKWNFDNHVF